MRRTGSEPAGRRPLRFVRVTWSLAAVAGLLALTLAGAALAQPTVVATVDRNPAVEGEGITLTIEVRGADAGSPRAPAELEEDFVIRSRGKSSQFTITNGRRESSVRYEYALIPQRAGALTVPPFVVTINGTLYQTEPISLQVEPRGSSAAETGVGEVFLSASVDRERVVVGEQVVLTLTFGHARDLVDRPSFTAPTFNGFVTERFPDMPQESEIVNGARYTVLRIRYALFPLGSGSKTIGPATVTASVPRRRRRDPFGSVFGGLFDGRPVTVTSEPVTVVVDPLPETDDPAFTGAIGEFRMKASLDVTKVNQNDPVTLEVEISGVGNIGSPVDSNPPPAENFRVFDASVETETPIVGERRGAVRRIRRAYVPLVAGEQEVPEVRFTYFDTRTRSYRRLTAGPYPIEVAAVEGDDGTFPVRGPGEVEAREELRFIHTGEPRTASARAAWAPAVWGHVVPTLALVVGWGLRRRRDALEGDPARRRARAAAERARRSLAGPGADPWKAVAGYVADVADADGRSLTGPEAERLLAAAGVSEEAARDVREFGERWNAARFAPGGADGATSMVEEARRLIDGLERGRAK